MAFLKRAMEPEHLSAADGFVITMLVMMAISLGVLGVMVLCMRRAAARRDRQVDELLEEIAEAEKREKQAPAGGENPNPAEPWEREGDWWKQ